MVIPNRKYVASNSYRYGFNGKENDNEVKGEVNQQDYGMRVYDPRLGKFLSVDAITKDYPELTPYQFASNTPIAAIDIDGLEGLAGDWQGIYNSNKPLIDDLIAGKRTARVQSAAKVGGGIVLVGALAMDAFFTKGWATRTLLASQVFGAMEHNRATTPEGRIAQDKRGKEALADAFITWGMGRLIGTGVNGAKMLATDAKRLYNFGSKVLGDMGEEALSRQYGTIKPSGKGSSMSTSLGSRKVDGIPAGTTITSTDKLFEAKVGFQNFSGDIVSQVAKDEELLATKQVKEITWVFYRSPTTGKVGASDALIQELNRAGIKNTSSWRYSKRYC